MGYRLEVKRRFFKHVDTMLRQLLEAAELEAVGIKVEEDWNDRRDLRRGGDKSMEEIFDEYEIVFQDLVEDEVSYFSPWVWDEVLPTYEELRKDIRGLVGNAEEGSADAEWRRELKAGIEVWRDDTWRLVVNKLRRKPSE